MILFPLLHSHGGLWEQYTRNGSEKIGVWKGIANVGLHTNR